MDEPLEIRKLADAVINRIAAGEIIQRPANALKELIENSLDAKATNIQITVKNGGLKLLQIQDNGTGIRKSDFSIVCERFTTSKLHHFEDLQSIATYGFRGEALASISHIAHLTITSKTAGELCAYKASFVDSKLARGTTPIPVAGNQGTIVTVEDLFYNMKLRKNSLRIPAEEYQRISEVVSKYAVHNARVGFALKKSSDYAGSANDIRTPIDSNCVDNIRVIYGSSIARELVEINYNNESFKFKAHGFVSNINFSTKKLIFLLFINHRLVDCQNLKRHIDQIYATYLPKNSHPFVYLSIELDPTTLDVNVHPTKHEVNFLNEEQIIEALCSVLETKLLSCNKSRVFYTQAKLPGVSIETLPLSDDASTIAGRRKTIIQPKDMVRTDASIQTLEKFFGSTTTKNNPTTIKDDNNIILDKLSAKKIVIDTAEPINTSTSTVQQNAEPNNVNAAFISKVTRVETQLTSVLELRRNIETNCHSMLRNVFAQHVYVGCVDVTQALIQCNTKLYLCNTTKIMYELFYQFIMYNFQNFDSLQISEPLSIREIALCGLDLPETGWTPDDGDKNDLAQKIHTILTEKGEMLSEYFSLSIDPDGNLKTLPLLLDNYTPSLSGLPLYIIRLATEVNWELERDCFDSFARETALYYSKFTADCVCNGNDWRWIIEHVFYAAIKGYFMPPKQFTENAAILEVADLPNLYKVFERC